MAKEAQPALENGYRLSRQRYKHHGTLSITTALGVFLPGGQVYKGGIRNGAFWHALRLLFIFIAVGMAQRVICFIEVASRERLALQPRKTTFE